MIGRFSKLGVYQAAVGHHIGSVLVVIASASLAIFPGRIEAK